MGILGGKAIRFNQQIYADIQLANHVIQVVFLLVLKLSRSCIIGIDLIDEFRSHIELDSKTISFPYLEGKPLIRIINEELTTTPRETKQILNSIQTGKYETEIDRNEIKVKVEEISPTNLEVKKQLEDILWRHRAVLRKKPGSLKTHQYVPRIKENEPFVGRSYPVPMAYRDKVDEKIKRMLDMGII